jgi:hypothetical protein
VTTQSTSGDPPADPAAGAEPSGPAGESPVTAPGGRGERALVIVTLVAILGASAAFVRAQTLKLEPSALKRPQVERFFSPRCDCEDKSTATVSFSLRRPTMVDAQVIDEEGRLVRTLLDGARLPRGPRRLEWDGRDEAGRIAPDGEYRLRLVLDREREVVLPKTITLDTEPPRAALISVVSRAIATASADPGRTRRRGRRSPPPATATQVRYRASDRAKGLLLVDGRPTRRTGLRAPGAASLEWRGQLDERPVRPGSYALSVRVRDRAGNLSAPTRSARVRVLRPDKR